MNVKHVIKERRAFRSLDPIEISGDLIKDLAGVAQIASYCANNQPWNFIFVYDQEQLQGIFTTVFKKKLEEFLYMNSYIKR
jgi:nitroreductase